MKFAPAKETAFYYYEKTQNNIKKMITENYQIGDKLPSIKELSESMDLSPNTIRKALHNLSKEGYLQFSRGRNMDVVCQAQTINAFSKIRESMLKLMCSSYISEVVTNFGLEGDPSSNETYNLLYNALTSISNSTEKTQVLISVIKFQLKMMLILGISPELEICLGCGKQIKDEDMYFSKGRCGVYCSDCGERYIAPIKLHYKIQPRLVLNLF